jgi:RNA polymerase sigma factor (sigma-70 family)
MTLESTWAPATAEPVDLAERSNADLVLLAREGNGPAREELARRLRQPAYSLALQLLRNPDDALDCAQDGLLRFFGSIHRLEAGRPVKPWLLTIVRNRARDLLRRKRVRRHESLEPADPDAPPRQILDTGPGPAALAERRELQERVWSALGRLPDHHREILVLRDYQDLRYAEIARLLSIPVGTVMSRLHRARKALRDVLLEEETPS